MMGSPETGQILKYLCLRRPTVKGDYEWMIATGSNMGRWTVFFGPPCLADIADCKDFLRLHQETTPGSELLEVELRCTFRSPHKEEPKAKRAMEKKSARLPGYEITSSIDAAISLARTLPEARAILREMGATGGAIFKRVNFRKDSQAPTGLTWDREEVPASQGAR